MQDFPAAHSMDTEWFAVDANGNLAIFDSGEGGAVPESNRKVWEEVRLYEFDSLLLEMAKGNDRRFIKLKIPGNEVAKGLNLKSLQNGINKAVTEAGKVIGAQYGPEKDMVKPIALPPLDEQTLRDWLLLLASDDVISQLGIEKIEYNYAVRFAGEPTIIYVKECRVLTVQKLVKSGKVLAGKSISGYRNGIPTLFGFFLYDQDSPSPLPYTRIGSPIVPLLLDDLPEHLQNAVSWNWFDRLKFCDREAIQPIEHTPCKTWGKIKWWVDTHGQEHEEHPDYPIL